MSSEHLQAQIVFATPIPSGVQLDCLLGSAHEPGDPIAITVRRAGQQSGRVITGQLLDAEGLITLDVGRRMAGEPEWKRRILEAPRVERVETLGEYGVTLKILGSVRAPEQWAARGEFRKRLLAALQANGIEIPRPQRVVLSRDPDAPAVPGLAPSQDELAEGTD